MSHYILPLAIPLLKVELSKRKQLSFLRDLHFDRKYLGCPRAENHPRLFGSVLKINNNAEKKDNGVGKFAECSNLEEFKHSYIPFFCIWELFDLLSI